MNVNVKQYFLWKNNLPAIVVSSVSVNIWIESKHLSEVTYII